MSRTIDIKLGEMTYSVPVFNLKQLREVGKMQSVDRDDLPFKVLLLALSRATPPIESEEAMMELEPEPGEFAEALRLVMEAAGLRAKGDIATGEAEAPAAA